MLRWIFVLAIVARVCAIRVPLIQLKSEVHREPFIDGPIQTTDVETEYVEQRVDNFDPTNDATWQMVNPVLSLNSSESTETEMFYSDTSETMNSSFVAVPFSSTAAVNGLFPLTVFNVVIW